MNADHAKLLLQRLQPPLTLTQQYKTHRATIQQCLQRSSTFEINSFRIIGSYSRQTAIRGTSDLDLLVVLTRDSISRRNTSSSAILNKVRRALCDGLPNTHIRRSEQAVKVSFGDGLRPVDVVPGIFGESGEYLPGNTKNYPVFYIPDGNQGWLATSPEAHNRIILEENVKSGGMLRRIAQLLKLWRNAHSELRLNSFFVELLLIQERICRPGRSYGHTIFRALSALSQRRCAAVNDPLKLPQMRRVPTKIFSAQTVLQREEIRRVASSCRKVATEALRYEAEKDTEKASECWQYILGYRVY